MPSEITLEELALESAELLPDRETLFYFNKAIAANSAYVSQSSSATASGGGFSYNVAISTNYAEVNQTATATAG